MSYNFPNAPSLGTVFSPAGGPVFTWNGAAWAATPQGIPVSVFISDTAPSSPANGQLWWESDTGNMFIWYSDPDSQQWVQVSGAVDEPGPVLIQQQFITSSGTLVLHADTKVFLVEVQGGGGGGGNTAAAGASLGGAGSGGGAGGYSSRWITRPSGAYSPTITVGASAASATIGNFSGFSDGTYTINGNGGGAGVAAGVSSAWARAGGAGGPASGGGGVVTAQGEMGGVGFHMLQSTQITGFSGTGGSSRYGMGGTAIVLATTTATHSNGVSGTGYGAGGGGAVSACGGNAVAGGSGSQGCVIITEFR